MKKPHRKVEFRHPRIKSERAGQRPSRQSDVNPALNFRPRNRQRVKKQPSKHCHEKILDQIPRKKRRGPIKRRVNGTGQRNRKKILEQKPDRRLSRHRSRNGQKKGRKSHKKQAFERFGGKNKKAFGPSFFCSRLRPNETGFSFLNRTFEKANLMSSRAK